MTIFYFTSTGNSLYVAKKIGNNDSELISIPQIINHSTLEYTDDVIGVVFPIYGFGLPKMVHKFLEKVKLNAEYTFAIGTYGNLSGAAMLSANKFATKRGRGFDYVESLLMFDNYLPLFEVAHETERTKGKHTEENLSKIISNINARKKQSPKVSIVWKIISAIIKGGEKFVMSNKQAQNYIIDEKCVKCEICAKICPAHNITVTDKVYFGDKCEWCLGCVHLCPKNAIHLKNEKSTLRYRHPDVAINEIIAANAGQ